jgi:hypothetical protein
MLISRLMFSRSHQNLKAAPLTRQHSILRRQDQTFIFLSRSKFSLLGRFFRGEPSDIFRIPLGRPRIPPKIRPLDLRRVPGSDCQIPGDQALSSLAVVLLSWGSESAFRVLYYAHA